MRTIARENRFHGSFEACHIVFLHNDHWDNDVAAIFVYFLATKHGSKQFR